MTMDRNDVNSWVQTYSGAQLRTFDKTVTFTINAYTRATAGVASVTTGANYTQRFEYVNANNTLYNNYVDVGISQNYIIYPQDIVDTLEDLTRRTVDLIEGRISNRTTNAYFCHSSCHTSCHSSRGRR
tara:strand:- start:969 stop:1352 length:384 start_codon:yes stop_codon:yes gene_type:complete